VLQAVDVRGDPFLETPEFRFTYHHEGFRRLVADLLFARMSDRQGLTLIEGPVGAGKTTVLVTLAEDAKLSPVSISIAGHEKLRPARLMDLLCRSLQIPEERWRNAQTVPDRIDVFGEAIAQRKRHEGAFLLLVDRAETLPRETIRTLVKLSELRRGARKLLHPILTVDCEDDDGPLPSAFQGQEEAIAFRFWLGSMDLQEVGLFVEHRMTTAGFAKGSIFTAEAIAQVARISGGLPGLVIPLCHEALSTINAELDVEITGERVVSTACYLGMDVSTAPKPDLVAEDEPAQPAPVGHGSDSKPEKLPPKEVWLDDLSVAELVPELNSRLGSAKTPNSDADDQDGATAHRSVLSSKLAAIRRIVRWRVAGGASWRTRLVAGIALLAVVFVVIGIMSPGEEPVTVRSNMAPDEIVQLQEQLAQLSGRLRELEAERSEFQRTISAFQLGKIENEVGENPGITSRPANGLVFELQQALSDLGYDPGLIDGAVGSLTRQAIKDYQRDHNLEITGEPHVSLLAHMTAFERLKEAARRYDEKDYAGAIEAYDQVLRLQPRDADAQLFRGLARLKLGEFVAGAEDMKRSADLKDGAGARYTRARIYYIQERLWDLGFDPGERDGKFGERTARAITTYQRVQGLPLNPQPTRDLLRHLETYSFHVRAVAAYRSGDYDKAVAIYTLVLALSPNNAEAHFNRGLAYKQLGRYDLAHQDYDNAIVLDPSMAKAYYDRANLHLKQGRLGAAAGDYGVALLRWIGLG
jgi:MSHA biogenesis protein MshM